MTARPIYRTLWIAKNRISGAIAISTLSYLAVQVGPKFVRGRREGEPSWSDAEADGWEAVEVDLVQPVSTKPTPEMGAVA